MRIVDELVSAGDIGEDQAECWRLKREGYTYLQIRARMRRSASLLWKWYQQVQMRVEQQEDAEADQGAPLAGVTIYEGGNEETQTPFRADPVLKALGF